MINEENLKKLLEKKFGGENCHAIWIFLSHGVRSGYFYRMAKKHLWHAIFLYLFFRHFPKYGHSNLSKKNLNIFY